jgi:histidinol-phosphate aminotransferase
MGIPEERLLLSYGSEDMLKQTVHCYLGRGETLLLPDQSWWYYKKLAEEAGGTHVSYRLEERGDRFVCDEAEILRLYDLHRPRVILIASPNNPTGNTIDPLQLDAVLEHCRSSVIVLDEAYAGFGEEPGDRVRRHWEAHERLVVLRTFSKYYALAGLRIGFACVGTDLERLIGFSARYLGYNRLSEQIALAALSQPEYYRTIALRMVEDKERYRRFFSPLDGYVAFRSDANFLLVRYPAGDRESLRSGLTRRGIALKFLDDPGLTDCLRITIGTREQNDAVIAALGEIVGTGRLSPKSLASP